MRNAIASAWPRTIAASAAVSLRGGSGSRALPPATPGRSAANATSSSGRRAMARRHPVTARLNGSFGASLAGGLGLMWGDRVFLKEKNVGGQGPERTFFPERGGPKPAVWERVFKRAPPHQPT